MTIYEGLRYYSFYLGGVRQQKKLFSTLHPSRVAREQYAIALSLRMAIVPWPFSEAQRQVFW
jgi:hypothetical protein